jgi:4-amino-4-deoxy-L-arabinose transferase-like glycosyltransferase
MKRLLGAVLVFAASLTYTLASGRQHGDFRIDEAHKLSETYYFRLLRQGQLHHPDWFRSLVERINPPLGKYLFGAAIATAGLPLPTDLTVAERVNHGQHYPPAAVVQQYRDYLEPARTFIALITGLTAALVFLLGFEMGGLSCGIIAALLYATSFLTEAFSATASFDPLLSFFVALAAVPALMILRTESAALQAPLAAAAGIAGGAAFSIRVTGLIALAAVFAMLAIWGLMSERTARAAALAIVAGFSCAVLAIAVNPYYWATSSDPTVPLEFRSADPLPQRILDRGMRQLRDLKSMEARELREQFPLRGLDKARFVSEYVFGDLVGMAILAGVAFLILRLALRRQAKIEQLALVTWSAAIIVILTAWLPLGYPRYVLVAIPPFALLAALGWSTPIESATAAIQKRRRIQLTTRSVTPK